MCKLTTDESVHVCHRGYISLFPFLLGLVPPDSPHLTSIFDLVTSPNHLWSDYGIRSLSKSHPLFGKDENYWRGPIWVQMNWLALKALKERYTVEDGPEKGRAVKIYNELRKRIIDNVFKVSRITLRNANQRRNGSGRAMSGNNTTRSLVRGEEGE